MKRFIYILLFFGFFAGVHAQRIGIKTNTLYWATTTPNAGMEFRLGEQSTLSVSGSYNPFGFNGAENRNAKMKHWLVMPEFKYWFCRSFERSNVGLHGIYAEYNIGGIPFIEQLKDHRYQGNAYGGGVSWGYQWATGNRWGLEFSVGAGYLHLHYKKYDCGSCGDMKGEYKRNYFGPTKLALSVIYFIK